jgi:hypothetical protein
MALILGNVTSKSSGVTRYCLCHVLKAINFSSDNGSNFDSLEMTPFLCCDKTLGDNTKCNKVLSL